MEFLSLTLLLFCLSLTHSIPNNTMYDIESIEATPGLYYESLGLAFIKRTDWKIGIEIDVEYLRTHLFVLPDTDELLSECKAKMDIWKCTAIFETAIHKNNTLLGIQSEISDLVLSTGQEHDNNINPPRTIRKRRLAPLGVIGDIGKGLFGIATTDDVELINRNLDQLFRDQKDSIRLTNDRAHIIAKGFEKIHLMVRDQAGSIREDHDALINMIKQLNQTAYLSDLMLHMSRIVNYLDQLIASSHELLNILTMALHQRVHNKLLTSVTLHKIHRDIQSFMPDVKIPVPNRHLNSEEIARISGVDIVNRRKTCLVVIIKVPLVEISPYEIYKLHSLPAPQFHESKVYGSAYIEPSHDFIMLSADDKSYIKLSTHEFSSCIKLHYGHICVPLVPIRKTSMKNDCELLLIKGPSIEALRTCKIMYKHDSLPTWNYLQNEGSWLFSTPKPLGVRVTCTNRPPKIVRLSGVGILRIAPTCTGQTDENTLSGEGYEQSLSGYVYRPDVSLRLDDIHPHIKGEQYLELTKSSLDAGEPILHDESLQQITRHLNEISEHKRAQNATSNTYIILIVIILITFCGTHLIWCWVIKFKDKSSSTAEPLEDAALPLSTPKLEEALEDRETDA